MYTIEEILQMMETLAPPQLAESWDNVGLLVDSGTPVTGVLCALDITPAVVAEARKFGCQLVISHHPVIFHPFSRLTSHDAVYQLAQAGISAICMHTNLDCADGGTNDTLAALLGLQQVHPYAVDGDAVLGRIGTLPEAMSAADFAAWCQALLHTAAVRFVAGGKPVRTVAIVTGAGCYVQDALTAGADCLLTGEVRHHEAIEAAVRGLTVVEAGHYGTERPIVPVLAQKLAEAFPKLQVRVSVADTDPLEAVSEA